MPWSNPFKRRNLKISSGDDPNNSKFPARDTLPHSVFRKDILWDSHVVLDQDSDANSVGYGIAHHLASDPTPVHGVTADLANELSHIAQYVDHWTASEYSKDSLTAVISVAKHVGFYDSYYWGDDIVDVLNALVVIGPVIIVVDWYMGMAHPRAGRIKRKGRIVGRQCLLIIGYNIETNAVLVKNSWGKGWGHDGTAWLPMADLQVLLRTGGVACIPIKSTTHPL